LKAVKRLALLFCLLCVTTGLTSAADRRIAFERDNAVYTANLEATVVRKLADGVTPAISPDASRVVFATVEKSETPYTRRIAIVETTSGKVTILKDIPSDNSSQPSWSPNSEWIAFVFTTNGVFRLGKIKSDGTGFKLIRSTTLNDRSLYSPSWSRDGASFFCHDTTNLYRLALDGSLLAQWKIEQIVPNGAMSVDGRIDVSPDGQRLLLSVEMDEEHTRKGWDGPVPALWSFDLTTQHAVRLTSQNLFAWDGCWLDDANILFLSQRTDGKQVSIYRTNGTTLKRLIEDARRPSVSRTDR
jgi:TolB protein